MPPPADRRPPPGVAIRAAGVGDAAAVVRLWLDAGAEPGHTDDVGSLARLIAHDGQALMVAEVDGAVVGSVIAGWDGWRGSIYRLVVAPAHRRQGLARRMLSAAEARLAGCGAARLQAVVVADDRRATGFWRSGHWEEQERRLRFVKG